MDEELSNQPGFKKPPTKIVRKCRTTSQTDPDSGYINHGSKRGIGYLMEATVDCKHGILTGVDVYSANEKESVLILRHLERQINLGIPMSRLALDRGYETGAVHRGLELLGITGYIPAIQFSNPPEKYGFSYDPQLDAFICPEGVPLTYDNCMRLEQLYNGRQFPEYLYDNSKLGLKIVPAEGQKSELLWLPASEQQIRRTLLRAGVRDADTAEYVIDAFFLQKEVGEILDEKQDSLSALNAMSSAIAKLDEKGQDKLEAVIVFADPKNAAQICQLAKNLDQFSFIPGVHTPEEYGKYMIQESGRFEYDDNLDGFYNYKSYGEHRIQQEDGCFSAYGYVAYRGMLSLEELMAEDPAEQTQQNQGPVMGMRGFS